MTKYILSKNDKKTIEAALETLDVEKVLKVLNGLYEANRWISVEESLPEDLETVWVSNGKGFVNLGCIGEGEDDSWIWGVNQDGEVYSKNKNIIAECEQGDYDVKYWRRLPKDVSAEEPNYEEIESFVLSSIEKEKIKTALETPNREEIKKVGMGRQ